MTTAETVERRDERKRAVNDMKRALILEAARAVFEAEGLEAASLRAIAAKAGYTPAALYFHFDSKEALYGAVLQASLSRLSASVEAAVAGVTTPEARIRAAALAFFDFYRDNPRDLDLGFYLFRGGMRPQGLGRERDRLLNDALAKALAPIGEATVATGAGRDAADGLVADLFAHATGILLLAHTGRIRMFGQEPRKLMEDHLAIRLARLKEACDR